MKAIDVLVAAVLIECLIYLWRITKVWAHVLVVTVILEFFRIKGFLIATAIVINFSSSILVFFFLVLMVCEACLGISLIVTLGRATGGETMSI